MIKNILFIIMCLLFLNFSYSINVSNCMNISSSGIYNLDSDILNYDGANCFEIRTDNINLNCNNHLIDGNGNLIGNGIRVNSENYGPLENLTIENCYFSDFNVGLYLLGSSSNKISDSSFINLHSNNSSNDGFHLFFVNSSIFNNISSQNSLYQGIYFRYGNFNNFNKINLINNTNDGFYLQEVDFSNFSYINTLSNGNNGFYSFDSDNDKYYYLNSTFNEYNGFILQTSDNNNLSNFVLNNNNLSGLRLYNSINNNHISNLFSKNNLNHGIYSRWSYNNYFNEINLINNSYSGIYIQDSNYNNFSNINLNINLERGMYLYNSNSNIFKDSSIFNNTLSGFYFFYTESGGNNTIYNNFFNNSVNIVFGGTNNFNYWNNSNVGNYWAEIGNTGFSQNCLDNNEDNICDLNYTMNINNIDFLSKSLINIISIDSSQKKSIFPFGNSLLVLLFFGISIFII